MKRTPPFTRMQSTAPQIKGIAQQLFNEFMPIAMIVRESNIAPDEVIEDDFIKRWWLAKIAKQQGDAYAPLPDHTRETADYNLYLHCMTGSDKNVLHDHPWANTSLILEGKVADHTPIGVHYRGPGDMAYRRAEELHRLEVLEGPVWSLFLTGRKIREWGFQLPNGRWAPWATVTQLGADGVRRYIGPYPATPEGRA
jgi:hypothetical protein